MHGIIINSDDDEVYIAFFPSLFGNDEVFLYIHIGNRPVEVVPIPAEVLKQIGGLLTNDKEAS